MISRPDPDALGFVLIDVARMLRSAFERRIATAGLGLTPGEARALVRISSLEGSRQLEIAQRMGIEPMTLVTCCMSSTCSSRILPIRAPAAGVV